jgi:integrase
MESDTTLMRSPVNLAVAGREANRLAGAHYFQDYAQRVAVRTRQLHRSDLSIFVSYLHSLNVVVADVDALLNQAESWEGVTHGIVEGFRQYLVNMGYAITSINRRLSTVKRYAALAALAGVISEQDSHLIALIRGYGVRQGRNVDATRPATRKSTMKTTPTPLSPDQVALLIEEQPKTFQGWRDRFMLCLFAEHGLRVGEVLALRMEHCNVEEKTFTFYREKVAKTQRHRMTESTYHAYTMFQRKGGPLTGSPWMRTNQFGEPIGGMMSMRAMQDRIRVLGRRIGIETLSPHDLRHYWSTSAIEAGTDIKSLQDAGGWASPAMPLRYAQSREIANDGVKLIKPVVRGKK